MNRLPTLRQLQYFLAVAETLSITEAASICHISQSALSNGLQELESLLGEKLFERATRRVALTRAGQDLVSPAKALIENAENFVRRAQRHRAPLTGPLALGVIPTIAPYLLPRLLPALTQDYPKLDLTLREDLTARLLDALQRGTLDVVLMAFPFDTPMAEQDILFQEPFFFVHRAATPTTATSTKASASQVKPVKTKANRKTDLTLDDLNAEHILLLDDGHCLRDHVISACHLTQSPSPRKAFGATSLSTLIQMVRHGLGTTLLPAMAIDPSDPPKGLNVERFAAPQPTRQIGLAWRKHDPRESEFRLLGQTIKDLCRTPAGTKKAG